MPLSKYHPQDYTWGFELEVGDVDRSLVIPSNYGSWEYSERDIINIHPPYQYQCADPMGVLPPVGGEINTVPTKTIEEQVLRIKGLIEWFKNRRYDPSVCCTSHSHIHVRVPGLRDDIAALKNLTRYIYEYQKTAVDRIYQFRDSTELSKVPGARAYLKFDGGRLMPDWMVDNILTKATDFDSFITLQCCGKDGKSRGRPFRYAINTYCLKHIDTVEFRFFRSTLNPGELLSCFEFVKEFMYAALVTDASIASIFSRNKHWKFPPFRYSIPELMGWKKTKWGENRGKKERRLIEIP